MLQVSYIRDNREQVLERLAVKNFKQPELVDEIIRTDAKLRDFKFKLEIVVHDSKFLSSQIPQLKRNNSPEKEIETILLQVATLKLQEPEFKRKVQYYSKKLERLLVKLPNLPHYTVPRGYSPDNNETILESGVKPFLSNNALQHWDLALKYDLIDFELGNKITGKGFPVYKNKGAKLQRALINFFIDEAENAGYSEVGLPLMVNYDSAFGTGQLPDKEGQMYYVKKDNLYLIPTAEVPITNLYRDVILKAEELPVKNCGYTPCFRREAGSYGKDVRGLNRLHQFDKVEIVQIVNPHESYKVHEQMCLHVRRLLEKLELPFRILNLCGGDMSFASALTYDFETWSAAQQRWLEVSSVSNFETFQSNRLKLRFRNAEGKPQLAHTLNGSALALPRIVATLLENNQTEIGIKIPEVLHRYTGFTMIC